MLHVFRNTPVLVDFFLFTFKNSSALSPSPQCLLARNSFFFFFRSLFLYASLPSSLGHLFLLQHCPSIITTLPVHALLFSPRKKIFLSVPREWVRIDFWCTISDEHHFDHGSPPSPSPPLPPSFPTSNISCFPFHCFFFPISCYLTSFFFFCYIHLALLPLRIKSGVIHQAAYSKRIKCDRVGNCLESLRR